MKALRDYLDGRGETVNSFAVRAGLLPPTVYPLYRGIRTEVSSLTLEKIKAATGISIDELVASMPKEAPDNPWSDDEDRNAQGPDTDDRPGA